MQAEKLLINRVLQTGRIQQAIASGVKSEHMHKFRQEWEYLLNFYTKHGELPTPKVFCERFPDFAYSPSKKKALRVRPAVDSVIDNHVAIEFARALKAGTEGLDEKPAMELVEEMLGKLQGLVRVNSGDIDFDIASDFDTDFQEFMRLRDAHENDEIVKPVIQSPWPVINEEFGGFLPGTVTGVLARLNVGKSWLLAQAAVWAALNRHRVFYASLEMKRQQTVARVHSIASFYMMDARRKKGKYRFNHPELPPLLDAEEAERFLAGKPILRNSHLSRQQHLIDPTEYLAFGKRMESAMSGGFFMPNINRRTQGFTLETFISKLERTEAEIGFLDFFGLLEMDKSADKKQRWEGWSKMSAQLKMAAEHLNIPIVVALQANRNGAHVRTPETIDIADSDTIGRDLDNIISIASVDGGLSATVVKHRGGRKGFSFPLLFYPEFGIIEQDMHSPVEYDIL